MAVYKLCWRLYFFYNLFLLVQERVYTLAHKHTYTHINVEL